MLAIAIISLVSAGLFGLAGGDDDFDTIAENEDLDEVLDTFEQLFGDTEDTYTDGDLVFTPDDDPFGPDPYAPVESDEETPRPPVGEDFRDPIIVAQEAEAAAAIARAPETLLTATDPQTGDEIDDDALLRNSSGYAEDEDRDYVVKAPEGDETDIHLGYNPDTTFRVELTDDVRSVTIGLNSNVSAADSVVSTDTQEVTDENGATTLETVQTHAFEGGAQINLQIDQWQIGTHVAQIDLSNPADELSFQFSSNVGGNLHLISNTVETDSTAGSITEQTVYVIQTAWDVEYITAAEISQILSQDGDEESEMSLVAEINLGSDSLRVTDDETFISDFMNDAPQMFTNVAWTSTGAHDGSVEPVEGPEGEGAGGGSLAGGVIPGLPFDLDNIIGTLDDLVPEGEDVPDFTIGDIGALTEDLTEDDTPPEEDTTTNDDLVVNLFDEDPAAGLEGLNLDELNDLTPEQIQELIDFADGLEVPDVPSLITNGGGL